MKCKPALEKIQLGGKPRTKFQNCQKLWQPHFKHHREQRIIDQHNDLMAFLEGQEQQQQENSNETNDEDSASIATASSSLQVHGAQATTPRGNDNEQDQEEAQKISPESAELPTSTLDDAQTLEMLRLQLADDITRYLMLKAKIEKCDSPPNAALETELREKVDSFLNSSIFPSNVSETNEGVSHTTINSNNIDTYHSPEKKDENCL